MPCRTFASTTKMATALSCWPITRAQMSAMRQEARTSTAPPDAVIEHYSGMIVEAFDCGKVIRVERRNGTYRIKVFSQDYFNAATSRGHTWLPINLGLDASRKYVFCNFNGLRPRLVGRNTYDLYNPECLKPSVARNIPEVHMRLRADDLTLDLRSGRSHLALYPPQRHGNNRRCGDRLHVQFLP